MSHRVFKKIQVSRDVMWLRNSFSWLFGKPHPCEVAGASGTGRTLAGNAGYSMKTVGIEATGGAGGSAEGLFSTAYRDVDDWGLVWTGIDRLLGLNGRYRLSC